MKSSNALAVAAIALTCAATYVEALAQTDAGVAPKPTITNAEIIVLHGTNDGSGIDPKIGKIPELSKPPFSSYDSFKLLERMKAALENGKTFTTKLPSGRQFTVTLKDTIEPKKKDEQRRYLVTTAIQKPGGNTFLPLTEVSTRAGEWIFASGEKHKGGMLVVGIKVLP